MYGPFRNYRLFNIFKMPKKGMEATIKRIEVSSNFYLDEFLDPYTYLFDKDNGLDKIDFKMFQIAQKVRELHGKTLVINTWWSTYIELSKRDYSKIDIVKFIENNNGLRKWSGLRTNRSDVGAKNGAHYKGQAIDMKGSQHELFKIVKDNAKEFYCIGVRRLEDPKITNGWLHLDTMERNTKPNSIRVVDLTKETETIYF